jgi:anthranilate synthase/aminodeoxychorismate synthase-like glutamine amidotransferase
MLLMIDNYDSFTYNLVQYFQSLEHQISVFYNDQISVEEIQQFNPSAIIISPGPNTPKEAGISVDTIQTLYKKTPILGICLGHQAISYAFGGEIIQAKDIQHGKQSKVYHHQRGLFQKIPSPFDVTRYHSLMVDVTTLPRCFSIDAWTNDQTIMGISHERYPLFGLQFHPESFLTQYGMNILNNFLKIAHYFENKEYHDYQYI